MSNHKCISIQFCGGCNVKIDRGQIAEKVREALVLQGHSLSYNKLDVDGVIFLSGCTANCAQHYHKTEAAVIVVAGATVDSIAVDESTLVIEILNKVRDWFE